MVALDHNNKQHLNISEFITNYSLEGRTARYVPSSNLSSSFCAINARKSSTGVTVPTSVTLPLMMSGRPPSRLSSILAFLAAGASPSPLGEKAEKIHGFCGLVNKCGLVCS